jgi:hypothetical protein
VNSLHGAVLLQKFIVAQLDNTFPVFYGTKRFEFSYQTFGRTGGAQPPTRTRASITQTHDPSGPGIDLKSPQNFPTLYKQVQNGNSQSSGDHAQVGSSVIVRRVRNCWCFNALFVTPNGGSDSRTQTTHELHNFVQFCDVTSFVQRTTAETYMSLNYQLITWTWSALIQIVVCRSSLNNSKI